MSMAYDFAYPAPFDEIYQQWRALPNTAFDLTGRRFVPLTSHATDNRVVVNQLADNLYKSCFSVQPTCEGTYEASVQPQNLSTPADSDQYVECAWIIESDNDQSVELRIESLGQNDTIEVMKN